MSKGKLVVISGASGVGKGTVLHEIMNQRKDISFSVSATTRPPRSSEEDGVDYTFITREAFEEMIEKDMFLEYDNHDKHYYGTPRAQLEEKRTRGPVILDIEPKGAEIVRRQEPDAILIFVMPPSMEELERRLRSRNDTSEEQIRLRMERAAWEIEQRYWYDYVVVNDTVSRCAGEILDIINQ